MDVPIWTLPSLLSDHTLPAYLGPWNSLLKEPEYTVVGSKNGQEQLVTDHVTEFGPEGWDSHIYVSPWWCSKKVAVGGWGQGTRVVDHRPGSDYLSQGSSSPAQNSDKSGNSILKQLGLPTSIPCKELKRRLLPWRGDVCMACWRLTRKPADSSPWTSHVTSWTVGKGNSPRRTSSWILGGEERTSSHTKKIKWVFSLWIW